MKPALHPWLNSAEAADAARKAVRIPMNLLAGKALAIGADELISEAYAILTECALPPRDASQADVCAYQNCANPLDPSRRKGAKFCSPKCYENCKTYRKRGKVEVVPPGPASHIGSMWSWPEDQMTAYAIREVGYRLNNWVRMQHHTIELPASEAMANMSLAAPDAEEDSPRELLEGFLESKGLVIAGDESFEELCEAAKRFIRRAQADIVRELNVPVYGVLSEAAA